MPASVVIVDGLAVSYNQTGKGTDVLFLHGWADSKLTFHKLATDISISRRVTAIDLPGFGGSEAPKTAWNLTSYGVFVKHFCEKLNIKPEVVIGHSNGGALAIHMIAANKLQPKKLVLLAASGVRSPGGMRRNLIKALAKTGKLTTFWLPTPARQRLQQFLYGTVGSDMLVTPSLQETFKLTVRQDVQEDAANIRIPVLMIYGANDRATPIKTVGQRLHHLIRDSKLVTIPGAGHFVHHDAANDVARNIKEFLG